MIRIYSASVGTNILESHQMPHKQQTEVYTMQFKYVPRKHCLLFWGSIILLLLLNKQIAIERHLFIFHPFFFLWSLFLSLLDYTFIHISKFAPMIWSWGPFYKNNVTTEKVLLGGFKGTELHKLKCYSLFVLRLGYIFHSFYSNMENWLRINSKLYI